MRVLITGGSGFIGTNLLQAHLDRGDAVLNFDRVEPRNPDHSGFWKEGDILDRDHLVNIATDFQPDVVHHLAARTDIDGSRVDEYRANTDGVRHLMAAVEASAARRVVFASTQLVNRVGTNPTSVDDTDPPNAYGESKLIGERLVRDWKTDREWVIVRPTTIWGPWFGKKYQGLFRTVRAGRYLHPGKRRVQKYWGYVGNAADRLVDLATLPADRVNRHIFYLSDYDPYDLNAFAEVIRESWPAPSIRTAPIALLRLLGWTGDALKLVGRKFPMTSYRLSNMLANMHVDMSPLREACGPERFSVRQGVEQTIAWIREHEEFDRE